MTGLAPHVLRRTPEKQGGRRRAIFLDRDGVINRRRLRLVRDWADFHFLPGVLEALAEAAKREPDTLFVVATNQDFVQTGYILRDALDDVHARMTDWIGNAGGRIDAVYACVHVRPVDCPCRKPRPGMLLQAAKDYGIDLSRSWMIGDNAKDMRAGRAAGARTALVDPRLRTTLQRAKRNADAVARDLPEALRTITG